MIQFSDLYIFLLISVWNMFTQTWLCPRLVPKWQTVLNQHQIMFAQTPLCMLPKILHSVCSVKLSNSQMHSEFLCASTLAWFTYLRETQLLNLSTCKSSIQKIKIYSETLDLKPQERTSQIWKTILENSKHVYWKIPRKECLII